MTADGGGGLRLAIRDNSDSGGRLGLAVRAGGVGGQVSGAGSGRGGYRGGRGGRAGSAAAAAGDHVQSNRRALWRPVGVVQVVEVAAKALIEDGGITKRDGTIATNREARGDKGAGLGRGIELELVVVGNVGSAIFGDYASEGSAIFQDSILQAEHQGSFASTFGALEKWCQYSQSRVSK